MGATTPGSLGERRGDPYFHAIAWRMTFIMTFSGLSFGQYFPGGRKLVLLISIVLGINITIGAITTQEPMLAIGVVLAILLACAIMIWPDAPTLAVFFILYTNAAVVAVKFHNVPFIVGASVPLLLIIPLTDYLIFRRQKLIIDPILPLIFLFIVIQIWGTLFSKNIRVSTDILTTSVIEGLGLYFLIINVIRTPAMLRGVVWVLLSAGALIGGLSFYQNLTQTYDSNYAGFAQVSNSAFSTGEQQLQGEVTQPRLEGPIGEKNRFAQIMLMLVPLGIFQFLGNRSPWLRFLAAISTGLIALGLTLAFSRGAAVGFVVVLIVMICMRYIKLYQIIILLLSLILILQAVPEYSVRLGRMQTLSSLLADDEGGGIEDTDSSTQGRVTEMIAAGLIFMDHPWIGVGPGMYPYHYREYAKIVGMNVKESNRQSHSLYPGIAAENGASALICFLMIVALMLRNLTHTHKFWAQRNPELANIAVSLMMAIIAYMASSIFLHFAFVRYFWLIMGIAGATNYISNTLASAEKVQHP